MSDIFLLICFLSLKKSIFESKKNVFLFSFKSSFCSGKIQVLEFWKLKFYDVMKYMSMKKEMRFTD